MTARFSAFFCALSLLASASPAATVVLDTGHTQARPGSMSATGQPEYWFNLRLSDAVAQQLVRRGVHVRRVAADGREVALTARTAGTESADLFVSVHHDSIKQEWIDAGRRNEFAGFAVFASRKNPDVPASQACARQVGRAMVMAGEVPSRYHALPIAGENRPFFDEALGAHYFDDLVVLKTARSPAILIEAGVIANPGEEQRLDSPATVDRLASAITSGVVGCLSAIRAER